MFVWLATAVGVVTASVVVAAAVVVFAFAAPSTFLDLTAAPWQHGFRRCMACGQHTHLYFRYDTSTAICAYDTTPAR